MKTKWILVLAMLLAVGCADGDVGSGTGSATMPVAGLDIGNLAPEIEGEDITGTNMNLSDYRGKVVLLDFWGDW